MERNLAQPYLGMALRPVAYRTAKDAGSANARLFNSAPRAYAEAHAVFGKSLKSGSMDAEGAPQALFWKAPKDGTPVLADGVHPDEGAGETSQRVEVTVGEVPPQALGCDGRDEENAAEAAPDAPGAHVSPGEARWDDENAVEAPPAAGAGETSRLTEKAVEEPAAYCS